MSEGKLIVVGTGILLGGHLTPASLGWIKAADIVLYGVADPLTADWICSLNTNHEAMNYDKSNARRKTTYDGIVEQIMGHVRKGQRVCAVFYGHPGVLTDASHRAVRLARNEGFEAVMLPGISADACLYADLGIDPGKEGCSNFEATDFLIRNRRFDPTSHLILWQIAMVGNLGFVNTNTGEHKQGLQTLTDELLKTFPEDHEVVVYEAASYAINDPVIRSTALKDLPGVEVSLISTLYVPPLKKASYNLKMMENLNMEIPEYLRESGGEV